MRDYIKSIRIRYTVSSDISFISHEYDIVEIFQEIDDIVDTVFGCISRIRITWDEFYRGGSTERSIVEKDDVVECVFESFVVGPDFTHGRLNVNLTRSENLGNVTLDLW